MLAMEPFWVVWLLPVLAQVGIPVGLLVLGYLAGRVVERSHFRRIRQREAQPGPLLTNLRSLPNVTVTGSWFCSGNVVVASDYFKMVGATLKHLVGGRLRTIETLIERGRREALLRLREQAAARGADVVLNVRLTTSMVMRRSIEVIAYGTAVKLAENADG